MLQLDIVKKILENKCEKMTIQTDNLLIMSHLL